MLFNSNTIHHKRIFHSQSSNKKRKDAGLRASYLIALLLWLIIIASIVFAQHKEGEPTRRQWKKIKAVAEKLEGLVQKIGADPSDFSEHVLRIRDVVKEETWDSSSPQLQALRWLSLEDKETLSIQRYALTVIFKSTNKKQTWIQCCPDCKKCEPTDRQPVLSPTHHVCDWYGITCTPGTMQVKWMEWTKNGLSASELPKELQLLAPSLEVLWWPENANLQFEIPSWIGKLSKLQSLSLYETSLEGDIPSELYKMTELSALRLYATDLIGSISTEISQLSKLTWLWLQSNRMTGTLPTELASLKHLEGLAIHGNRFDGSLPSEICSLKKLELLWVDCVGNKCACCTKCFSPRAPSKDM